MASPTALSAAVQKLRTELAERFIGLLDEQAVRNAIPRSLEAYAARGGSQRPGGTDYLREIIEPALRLIAEEGDWPEHASWDYFFEHSDSGVTHRGFSVGLELRTPGARYRGFSLPILELWYGRWVPEGTASTGGR